ncbi:MAG: adenylate/guanylate cyclase domain-containing protein [Longimicrobiaceae bacterium]
MTPRRSIQSVLFTDIVDSTIRAARLGDRRWRKLLAEHNARARREMRRFGGREVKDLGDGFLAVFGRPAEAIRCAWEIRRAIDKLGLEITAGIHTGAIEDDGEDIGGIAVHVAARVHALAGPGETLVSHTTEALETGSGFDFEDRGEHELKGVPGIWRVFALRGVPEGAGQTEPETPEAGPDRSVPDRSIAVLPFQNFGRAEEAEIFAAGLHDDLLTQLAKISALTVISRTSVMGYRGVDRALPVIAGELGVGTLMEGGVQQAGDRIRLNVKLFDARREVQLWAESYDRRLTTENIFEIQSELATRIADMLRAELTPQEMKRVGREHTRDLHAYRLYVQGRTHLAQRTEHGMRRALADFQRAIEIDADYALAWAGSAEVLNLLEYYGYDPPSGALDPRWAAERAVELGPELGEAHTSLGILHVCRREAPAALRAFERGIDLSPGHADAHLWLGWMHLVVGRPDRGLAPAERALELDPLAPALRAFAAEICLANGKHRDALHHASRAVEIEPHYGIAHYMNGLVLYQTGEYEDAKTSLETALPLTHPRGIPSRGLVVAALGAIKAAAGDGHGARRVLGRIDAAEDPFSIGLVRAALGERDQALGAFERIERWPPFVTEHMRYFFPDLLDPIRNDPRYEHILERLEQSWRLRPA